MKKITLVFIFLIGFYGVAQNTCATAVPVSVGLTTVGTINGTDVPTPICALNGPVTTNPAGEWYSYTPTQNEVVTITTDLSQNDGVTNSDDTRVHIYTGTCGSLTCVAGNDDIDNANFLSTVSWLAESGTTYIIAWDNRWSSLGFDFDLSVQIPNCATALPFTEDFSSNLNFVGCYTVIDQDGNGTAWIQQELELTAGIPSFFATNGTNAAAKEDYLISPAIQLTAGQTYTISATYNGANAQNGNANEDLEVLVATGNTVADANAGTSIFTDTGIIQNGVFADVETQAITNSGQFTATTTGDHYIVFKSTGSPDPLSTTTGFLLLFEYSIDATLSVGDFNENQFNFFVDANNTLNLEATNLMEQLQVFNIVGQQVINTNLNATEAQVSVSALKPGVYLAKLQLEGENRSFKFVKR